ncbi:MAG: maleamate amidohydrolase [Zhongshania sp.]
MNLERKSLGIVGRPALLLVDMINGFTSSKCALGTDCPDVVAANASLLAAFRKRGLPVIFTTVVYHNADQAKVFRARIPALNCLTPDSEWVKIDPALAPLADENIIEKQWASSFYGTELDALLKTLAINTLVVTGLTTSGCVRATVVDGLQHDYSVVVPIEAVGDRNAQAHEANLFDIHAKYADVMKIDDVLQQLP